jgi:predicted RNase H-like HicB family nuclease
MSARCGLEVGYEGGMYWAQITEWPGWFASGETLEELTEALDEAITLYVIPEGQEPEPPRLTCSRSFRWRTLMTPVWIVGKAWVACEVTEVSEGVVRRIGSW